MILQLIRVKFSLNQPKYSPFTIEFSTTMFLLCQNASFVSSSEFFIDKFSIYWNEYFPFIFKLKISTFFVPKRKYSEIIEELYIFILLHNQPNSGDSISQPDIAIFPHSRKHFIPRILHFSISPSNEYHKGALVLSKTAKINNIILFYSNNICGKIIE